MFGIDEHDAVSWSDGGGPPGVSVVFNDLEGLTAAADEKGWSRQRLEAIYNNFVGSHSDLSPVKKFRNRPFGLRRIWDVVQRLKAGPRAETRPETEEPKEVVPAKKAAKPEKERPKAERPKVDRPSANGHPRAGSKAAGALAMLRRPGGASNTELQSAFGWQPHTVRGFVSTAASKHGLRVETETDEKRGRVYKVNG
jgi:hypothetical protein